MIMEGQKPQLESLSLDSLAGVVGTYPWFGAARIELCRRMASLGGSDWGVEEYSDAAMYLPSRGKVFAIMRSARNCDYSDKDLTDLLKKYIAPSSVPETSPAAGSAAVRAAEPAVAAPVREASAKGMRIPAFPEIGGYRRTVRPAGGDFFSSDEYESVRREEDNFFTSFRAERQKEEDNRAWEDPELGFCTETLAGIYAEQGYFAEAKKIYSKLILRYPEKSAYFASLIEKLQLDN